MSLWLLFPSTHHSSPDLPYYPSQEIMHLVRCVCQLSTWLSVRWGPYLQSCLWGFNVRKLKLSQLPYPMVHCGNRSLHTKFYMTYISTLEGPGSISCEQYLDQTLGKFPPIVTCPFLHSGIKGRTSLEEWGPGKFSGFLTITPHYTPLR